jgi:hypothetical protein
MLPVKIYQPTRPFLSRPVVRRIFSSSGTRILSPSALLEAFVATVRRAPGQILRMAERGPSCVRQDRHWLGAIVTGCEAQRKGENFTGLGVSDFLLRCGMRRVQPAYRLALWP